MTTRQVTKQRPSVKPQGRVQRLSFRDNPETGIVWGQEDWPGGAVVPDPGLRNLPPGDPDSSWTKAEIVAWLNANGDPSQDSLTKAELLDHVTAILSP